MRLQRYTLSRQKSDLDKAITHLTEVVLLSQTQDIVFTLLHLSTFLLMRFACAEQTDDLKSSIICLRFLRVKFHFLEAFDVPHASGDFASTLFHALAHNLVLTPGEMVQDLEEMVALIPEFITADVLTQYRKDAIFVFERAVATFTTEMYRQEDTQRVFNRVVEVLREATVLNPDLYISYILAMCLTVRFETTFVLNDFKEAIAILDKVVSTCSPGNTLTSMERNAMMQISVLLGSRMHLSPTPEHLEDAIRRLRTYIPCLPNEDRGELKTVLDAFTHKRLSYFGIPGNAGGPFDPEVDIIVHITSGPESEARSRIKEKEVYLRDINIAIEKGEITDVEVAVERSRKITPLQQSGNQWSSASELAEIFASILLHAYRRTERLDYLNEAITLYRDLRKISNNPHDVGWKLHTALLQRLCLLGPDLQQDFEELMQLLRELANDSSVTLFTRFKMSCSWALNARAALHPSVSMAYEMAMSLLEETLAFCPTLQTQHHRLADAFITWGRLPSDYASYRIENGRVNQAIETLERGKALIWSEMRDLRTSTDQLRTADPALADKFSYINRRLESVTLSVAQSDDDEIVGRSETGTGTREYSIGHLVLMQRRLLDERNSLISSIQSLPGFEDFLKPLSFDVLNSAAACGPVIIINLASPDFPSYIILLLKDSPPSIIPTPSSFYDRANQLETDLLRVRKEKGLDSNDYGLTLASVLSSLYELVGKPVIERLRELKVPEKSRVWWCLTAAFCSLPLHAIGPIPSDDGEDLYFSDLYISSYTPTLSALIESRKRGSLSDVSDNSKPSILLVAQPDTLPGAFGEIKAIEATKTHVKSLISAMATPNTVIEGLRGHRFAHFVCHGLLETGKPFDASLELHKDNLTLLEIVRSQLPAAEFAFLSACHTAELTEGSIADEGLHLAAAMQYCGFRSVVGTMWAMADTDGADLSRHFYKAIFADRAGQNVPYHERSARALQIAVKELRKKRGITLERWVNFVHYGA